MLLRLTFPNSLLYKALAAVAFILCLDSVCQSQDSPSTSLDFGFGPGVVTPGRTQVLPDMLFTKVRGYGFEPGASLSSVSQGEGPQTRSCIVSDHPFLFSVSLPEGNYQVTVTLGNLAGESKTTVKAEIRRLMVEKAHLAFGKTESRVFNVNIRTPQIPGGGEVRLKDREKGNEARAWDELLTLEFGDDRPCVCGIEIKKIENVPVVYICGDSTVCDQPGESYASWGQMLTRFFKPSVVIANHGESGESLRGFLGEKRWAKILSLLTKGDYVLVQMGHNDSKERGEGVGAFTTYKTDLKRFVADTRSKGATPILVTPMERRGFNGSKAKLSHGDYPEAVRQLAKEDNVAMIDLHAMSVQFYEALGPEKAHLAFAGNGDNRDATHHNNYGAYELAKCIVKGIKASNLELAKSIVEDFSEFDPFNPDKVDSFMMATGPSRVSAVPLGN